MQPAMGLGKKTRWGKNHMSVKNIRHERPKYKDCKRKCWAARPCLRLIDPLMLGRPEPVSTR